MISISSTICSLRSEQKVTGKERQGKAREGKEKEGVRGEGIETKLKHIGLWNDVKSNNYKKDDDVVNNERKRICPDTRGMKEIKHSMIKFYEEDSNLFLFISARIFSAMLFRSTSIFSTIAVRPSPFRSFSNISNLGPRPASTLISPKVSEE